MWKKKRGGSTVRYRPGEVGNGYYASLPTYLCQQMAKRAQADLLTSNVLEVARAAQLATHTTLVGGVTCRGSEGGQGGKFSSLLPRSHHSPAQPRVLIGQSDATYLSEVSPIPVTDPPSVAKRPSLSACHLNLPHERSVLSSTGDDR